MIGAAARAIRGPLPAPVLVVLVAAAIAIEAFVLLRQRDAWTQSQLGAVQWHALAALLLTPLAAAVAAIEAAAVASSLLGTLAAVQRRRRAAVLRAASRGAVVLCLVHVAGLIVALAVVRARGLEGPPPVEAALPGLAALVAGALVGAAAGWRMRRPIAAPVAAVGVFALLAVVADAVAPLLYAPGRADAVGLSVDVGGVLASLAAFALLSCAALGLAVATAPQGRAATAAAFAGLLVLIATGPSERTRPEDAIAVCSGAMPAVCAYPERRAWLAGTQPTIVRLQRSLTRLAPGVSLPARYSEAASSGGPRVATLQVADPHDRAALSQDVADVLVRCSDDAVEGYVALAIARDVFARADVPAAADLGLDVPAPLLTAERVRDAALREVRRTRARSC